MLPIGVDEVRVYLHVLAATVWVGGQLVVLALLPVLRSLGPDAPRAVAEQFGRVARASFGVLLLTGIWNIAAVDGTDDAYRTTLTVKLVLAAVSVVAAEVHARAASKRATAVWGAVSLVTALAVLFLGVVLG